MKQVFSAIILTATFAFATTAHADTKPESSSRPLRGGTCFAASMKVKDDKALWRCEHLETVTIKEIYEKGFRVVSVGSTDLGGGNMQPQYLVIEEQRR